MDSKAKYQSRNKYSAPVCLRVKHDLKEAADAYRDRTGVSMSPLVSRLVAKFLDGTIPADLVELPPVDSFDDGED